jgi:hypothetical protein
VVSGSAVKNATASVVIASTPNHFGDATTLWNVSFGEVSMPKMRATRLFGAGVDPAAAAVAVIVVP